MPVRIAISAGSAAGCIASARARGRGGGGEGGGHGGRRSSESQATPEPAGHRARKPAGQAATGTRDLANRVFGAWH